MGSIQAFRELGVCGCRLLTADGLKHAVRSAQHHQHFVRKLSGSADRLCPREHLMAYPQTLLGQEDRHKGIHVHCDEPLSPQEFSHRLQASLHHWRQEDRPAAWLTIPLSHAHLMSVAGDHGFTFHHAEGQHATLSQWLRNRWPSKVPRFATHQVGVAGCVVNEEKGEVLVVQDRPFPLWKFPGGLSELEEDIGVTAAREVYEETGVQSEFQGVLAFRQQHQQPGAFGRSDFYYLCHMTPKTLDINPDPYEILKCQWMNIEELTRHAKTTPITKRLCQILLQGLDKGFNNITLQSEELDSVYKGLKYKLYHRKLDTIPEYSEQ